MEAIHISPVFYELIADRAWAAHDEPLDQWIREFGQQRYGLTDSRAGEAWTFLLRSVLSATPRKIFPERFIATAMLRPTFALLDENASIESDIEATLFFEPRVLADAWSMLHQLAVVHPKLADGPLGADLVQIGTTVLLRLIDFRVRDILRSARARQVPTKDTSGEFLDLFDALDQIASTRPSSRIGEWEAAAAAWASHPDEEALLRDNARRLLTVWNTVENPHLNDYAARPWAGLVSGYYKERWKSWLALLPDALEDSRRETAQTRLDEMLADGSRVFLAAGASPITPASQDLIELSGELIDRFAVGFVNLRSSESRHEGHGDR